MLAFETRSINQRNSYYIIYNYINELAPTNSLNMRAIHLSCPLIVTSPLKMQIFKMINLSHMISIINFIFTILF
jgi:hypothetical protein